MEVIKAMFETTNQTHGFPAYFPDQSNETLPFQLLFLQGCFLWSDMVAEEIYGAEESNYRMMGVFKKPWKHMEKCCLFTDLMGIEWEYRWI